jgi:translocation and assembly module TamB
VQDYLAGLHLGGIVASLRAEGDTVRIEQFVAHAGPGTISAEGSVGALAPDLPVDLRVTAARAEPLATDLLTANLGADLTIRGLAAQRLDLAGTIHVNRASINVPEKFPQNVAVLDVRRPGQAPPAAPENAAGAAVALAVVIEAPEQVFVRGHGLDAEMGGTIHIDGTVAAPQISGGLNLRHGTVDLAGQTLNFTKGTVGFNGTGVQNKVDPTLDLAAETSSGGVTATLGVSGYADSPRIKLSSSPDLPQDEILAHLLFGQSTKQLTPLQIAQVAQGLASLTGVGGGFNPLAYARQKLGLDRLSTGAGSSGTGASVEAGKYVAKGVYVGAADRGRHPGPDPGRPDRASQAQQHGRHRQQRQGPGRRGHAAERSGEQHRADLWI